MPRKYTEAQVKIWIKNFESYGPYTAAEVVRLSHIFKRHHKRTFKHPLSDNLHKFSAKELGRLFDLDGDEKAFDAVEEATGYFMVDAVSLGRMNDDQLEVVAENWQRNDHCCDTLDESCLSEYEDMNLDLVKLIHRAEKRKREEKQHSAKRVSKHNE